MSDLQETNVGSGSIERVGDALRHARMSKGLTIEAIANELKLNAGYVLGIEESNYSKLPGLAYARVYIKSMSQLLGLNSELLLEQFSKEMNIEVSDPERERRDTISVKVQGTKKPNQLLPIIYITVALVLVALLLNNGKQKNSGELETNAGEDSLTIEIPVDTGELSDDALPKGVSAIVDSNQDSSSVPLPANEGNDSISVKSSKTDSASLKKDSQKMKADSTSSKKDSPKVTSDSAATVKDPKKKDLKQSADQKKKENDKKKLISFQIDGTNDSSWVKIFSDGKKVHDGIVARNGAKSFTAKDSLNIMIGKNNNVRYKLNGSALNIDGAGVKVLRIDSSKIELWRMNKWNSVFEGR